MKKLILALMLSTAALTTSGCQTLGSIAQSTTTATPKQANTLADAVLLDTIANRTVTTYVNTGNPNRETLITLQTDSRLVHDALVKLEQANAAGQSLSFAAVNAAYKVFVDYSTSKGVKIP